MANLYSSFKFLRFRDQIDALDRRVMAPPVHVRVKPINRCNHHCWYCAYRADDLQLGDGMDEADRIPEAKMWEIVDDLIAMEVKAVTFSGGGEPLLYKPLPDVVERLAGAGIRVASLTNGANLKGRMAEAFARHGTWLRISLDAWDDASYAASRGAGAGDFTKLIANMRAFLAKGGGCVLGVSFIVGHDNHTHILDVCRLLKEVGVNHVKVTGAVVANGGAENNRYHAPIVEATNRQIAAAQEELEDDRFRVINHYHELSELFEKNYNICAFQMFLTVIGADQGVYSCQDKAYTEAGRLGWIKERRFKEFWFSEENRNRLYGLDPAVSCRHHCVAHNKNLALSDYLAIDREHGVFV